MTDTISCLVYTEPPIARVALVKIVRRLSPFLQYNLDLIYFASPLPSLFFGPGGGVNLAYLQTGISGVFFGF